MAVANFGSSASIACSICSSTRCSCSDSGTVTSPIALSRWRTAAGAMRSPSFLGRSRIGRRAGAKAERGKWFAEVAQPALSGSVAEAGGGSRGLRRGSCLSGSTRLAGRTLPAPNRRWRGRRPGRRRTSRRLLASSSCRCSCSARHQPLDPHAHQPDPGALQPQRVVQVARGAVDLPGHVGGLAQGPGPGDRGEVGEPHLDRHRPAGHAGGPHPAGRPSPRAAAARAGSPPGRRCRGRTSRRRPCSCRLVAATAGGHRPAVAPPGQLVQVAARCGRPRAAACSPGCARRRRR